MRYLLLLTTLVLGGCTDLRQNFFKLKTLPDEYVKKYTITFEPADMFSLRIKEQFIIQGITSDNEYSDIPFRRYTQIGSPKTHRLVPENRKIDEETHLYLEGISAGKSQGVSLYLITMPLLENSLAEKYFNNPNKLFLKPVWEIYVGQWTLSADSLKITFTVDHSELIYKSNVSKNKEFVVLEQISYTGLDGREGHRNDDEPLMICIKDVLDTGLESGLVFNQIDKNTGVVISPQIKSEPKDSLPGYTIKEFVIYKKNSEQYRLVITTNEKPGEFLFATKRYRGTLTPKNLVVSDQLLKIWK